MGIFSSRLKENELLTELENLNVVYINLYNTYEYVKSQEQQLRSENDHLKNKIKRIMDTTNITTFLSDHDNSILEDTFEKAYITKYHSYLKTLSK
tara:strand:+ start:99 stop:383 length:285 start_codon:yes stop_codon:yes gene_type:complete